METSEVESRSFVVFICKLWFYSNKKKKFITYCVFLIGSELSCSLYSKIQCVVRRPPFHKLTLSLLSSEELVFSSSSRNYLLLHITCQSCRAVQCGAI